MKRLKRRIMIILSALMFAVASRPAAAAPELFPAAPLVPADAPLFMDNDFEPAWHVDRVTDRESRRGDGRNLSFEFTHLARFRDRWYISFREGYVHGNDIDGRGRVIRSADGVNWESVGLFESDTGDVRDPRLSVTSDGRLMLNASIRFIPGAAPLEIIDDVEVSRRSVTWLSDDGEDWDGPFFCPTGINTWRWSVSWHEGYGYSVGYSGKDTPGTLYRTRDGKKWESWKENFFPPDERYNEAVLTFGPDGTAWCLLRGGRERREATLGNAPPPYDGDWSWRKLDVTWHGSDDRRPFSETGAGNLGGPMIITLADGRMLAAARAAGLGIFLVDPREALMTRVISQRGWDTYPGLVEHEGEIWFTTGERRSVTLKRARIPGGG